MIRANFGVLQESRRVRPNGVYEAYRPVFDAVFTQQKFEKEQFKKLYIFDRFEPACELSVPPNWRRLELDGEPISSPEFEIPHEFGQYERDLISFLLAPNPGKVLRIIGHVGTGKSTFINFMFADYLPNQPFFKDGLILLVDLLKVLRVKDDCTYEETVSEVLAEIRRLSQPEEEESLHNAAWNHRDFLEYLRARVKASAPHKVAVVFDNGDTFSPSFQGHLAAFAQYLALAAGCTVVVATRQVNAHYFSDAGTADAGVVTYMYQQPPRLRLVVERRLNYLLEEKSDLFVPRAVRLDDEHASITLSNVRSFIGGFLKMLFSDKVSDAYENLTNYDVRMALLWALDFLRSYNLNVPAIIDWYLRSAGTGRAVRSIDDFDSFILAVALCNHQMYFPSSSRLENLFSAGLSNDHDLLIKYRCLKYCSRFDPAAHKDGLRNHLRALGYADDEIVRTVDTLLEAPRRLLESPDGGRFETLKTLRVTYAGLYYLNKMIYHISYIQTVSDDIILPEGIVLNRGLWSERMRHMMRFLDHLSNVEIDEFTRYVCSNVRGHSSIKEYGAIYSETPLATRILGSFRALIAGRLERIDSHEERQEAGRLLNEADELKHQISGRLRSAARHTKDH